MKKFYFLSSCNTCQRILDHLDLGAEFELQDIKKTPISSDELEATQRNLWQLRGAF